MFFNLYVVHDYYLAAITPALAALVGVVASWVWEQRPKRCRPAVVAVALVTLWLGWIVWPAVGLRQPDVPTSR